MARTALKAKKELYKYKSSVYEALVVTAAYSFANTEKASKYII